MKEGYIPKDQRKKILMLSDDIRTHSGVGCQSRNIVLNSAHHFNWVNLGGAVKPANSLEEGAKNMVEAMIEDYNETGYGTDSPDNYKVTEGRKYLKEDN